MATRTLVVFLFTFGILPAPGWPEEDPTWFARLRSLEGDWSLLDPTGEPSSLHARYEVVAGGAAVMETMFPGSAEETVTLYHAEGSTVTVTHLSSRTAPSRLHPAPVKEPGALSFVAPEEKTAPGTTVAIRLAPSGPDRLRLEWIHTTGRNEQASRVFDLRRETSLSGLSAEVSRLRVSLDTLQQELDRRLRNEVTVEQKGRPPRRILQTVTRPPGPGWTVAGVPFREFLHEQSITFSTTYSIRGDEGMTIGHFGFRAGRKCHVRFCVLGGHAFIAVVEESRPPPREIASIPEFATALEIGAFGRVLERISGQQWAKHPVAVDWDLERFAGKSIRLYVVDAVTNHYGQIAVSDIRIEEELD
ncbi:MAG: hypothetical protein MUE73_10790 [Planctomycetes bacterium]|jgi:hypothetical protein|nr:hypothetical protein [Planctomycetota bacterium]